MPPRNNRAEEIPMHFVNLREQEPAAIEDLRAREERNPPAMPQLGEAELERVMDEMHLGDEARLIARRPLLIPANFIAGGAVVGAFTNLILGSATDFLSYLEFAGVGAATMSIVAIPILIIGLRAYGRVNRQLDLDGANQRDDHGIGQDLPGPLFAEHNPEEPVVMEEHRPLDDQAQQDLARELPHPIANQHGERPAALPLARPAIAEREV